MVARYGQQYREMDGAPRRSWYALAMVGSWTVANRPVSVIMTCYSVLSEYLSLSLQYGAQSTTNMK